ncbi:hypothetical protein [Actinomadura formosensis]|uniref:hypothetical protein n=1 Tax=Actinomadura formosensis TaxID=60706 RepID=UPI00082DE6C2|nr:hypothetical protein [Actinomadura formosensis]
MLGHSSIVLIADTYTSVLPKLAHTDRRRACWWSIRLSVCCVIESVRSLVLRRPLQKGLAEH